MKDRKVAKTYSKLLFKKASIEKLDLEELSEKLCAIKEVINESRILKSFLKSAIVDFESKMEQFSSILSKIKVEGLLLKFIKIVIRNNKIDLIENIYTDFNLRLSESRGIILANLTIASDMKKSTLEECIKVFEKKLGKKIQVNKIVDPSIGGGMILQYGSNLYDLSVKGLYQKLNR